jgi:ABC-type nitrate/sulfonate/bicarbonate transport system substrate-binding protein
MNRFQFAAGAVAALGAAPAAARAAGLTEVTVSYFPGASSWPLYAALDAKLFEAAGLYVVLAPTPSSIELFNRLDSGTYDLAHTSIDNPIAYDIGAGAVQTTNRDFVAFFGVDDGELRLLAKPGTASIKALAGKTLAVDAMTTGYAFALREMLAGAGLGASDVTFVAKGGTAQRAQGLMDGAFDATLVTPPFNFQAVAKGFVDLGAVTDVVGAYAGIAGVARRAWLKNNRTTALTYLRVYRAALARVIADKPAAVALLAKYNPGLTADDAARTYDAVLGGKGGFARNAEIDLAGLGTVLRLRAKYAPPGAGSDPAAYLDPSILAAL